MTKEKDSAPPGRRTRESEIFHDRAPANYSSGIGAEQGLEQFSDRGRGRRARPDKTWQSPGRRYAR